MSQEKVSGSAEPKYCPQCGKKKFSSFCMCTPASGVDRSPAVSCPKCGGSAKGADSFCKWCGASFEELKRKDYSFLVQMKGEAPEGSVWCPNCGEPVSKEAGVCRSCMTNLTTARRECKEFQEACGGAQAFDEAERENGGQSGQQAFCTKCGASLPQGATFCGACGFEVAASTTVQQKSPKPDPATDEQRVSVFGIAARVMSVVTVVLMCMPWLEIKGVRDLSNYASAYGVVSSSGQYGMLDMDQAANFLSNWFGDRGFGTMHSVMFVLWAAVIILFAVCFVKSLLGSKDANALAPAGAVSAIVAASWAVAIFTINASYSSVLEIPFAVYGTIACGILTAVLSVTRGK